MLCIILLVIIERFQKKLNPFKLKENNHIEIKAIIAGTTILYGGLLFEEGSKHDYPLFNTIAFLIIIVYNSHFLLEWVYLFIYSFEFKNKKIKAVLEMYRQLTCKKKEYDPDLEIKEKDQNDMQK